MLFQYYGYGRFANVGYQLQRLGVWDIILPFMLVFAIIYAALSQINIFTEGKGEGKKPKKNINIAISFVIASMFIGPHMIGGPVNFYTRTLGIDPVVVINAAIPHVGLLAVAVTLALILSGLLGFGGTEGTTMRGAALVLCVIGLLVIFAHAMGLFRTTWLWFLNDPGLQMALVVLLAFGAIAYFIVSGDGDGGEDYGHTP